MKKIKSPALDIKTMKSIRDEILNSNQKQVFKDLPSQRPEVLDAKKGIPKFIGELNTQSTLCQK